VIEKQLAKMPGIKDVTVSYLTDTVLVHYDPEMTTTQMIRASVKKIGYDAVEHQ
jgi:copper chaperone CopZ